MPDNPWDGADIIDIYTRRQAIEDGVLVDLNDPSFTFRPGLNICAEAGIKYPVAMTVAAYSATVSEPGTPLPPGQDISGRLWDVLTMFKVAASASKMTNAGRPTHK